MCICKIIFQYMYICTYIIIHEYMYINIYIYIYTHTHAFVNMIICKCVDMSIFVRCTDIFALVIHAFIGINFTVSTLCLGDSSSSIVSVLAITTYSQYFSLHNEITLRLTTL